MLAATAAALPAADFVAPAEGPVAFRRDKVPLDADAIADLSKHLETLARGQGTATAGDRRRIAQMLALATALDPSNSSARELIAGFEKDTPAPKADPAEIKKCVTQIRRLLGWLEASEAGSHGHALAACLTDILPREESEQASTNTSEQGAWTDWVPALASYKHQTLVKNDEPKTTVDPPKVKPLEIRLPKAQVETVLCQKTGPKDAPKWVLGPAPLQMVAKKITAEADQPADFSLILRTDSEGPGLVKLATSIKELLKKQHGALPSGLEVVISSEELQKSMLSGKRLSISAAAAVLASAAITGREPDATILGLVDEKGAFKLPSGFWEQLQALGNNNGRRLVLPAAAAEYLPSFLALEKSQFFFEHEVVLASNFQELLDLSAKNPPETVVKASVKFQEIREKGSSQAVTQYVANTFIRRRLAELSQEAPFLYSARMLTIQGAGNRPTLIPRAVLVPELRHAIEPMAWITSGDATSASSVTVSTSDQLAQTYETCRVQVDRLDRYTEKGDRELLERVKEAVAAIRPLERAARSRVDDYSGDPAGAAHAALMRVYTDAMTQLDEPNSESEPVPSP